MCGIAGIVSFKETVDEAGVIAMRDKLRHRGPDGEGLHISPDRNAALAHRRLSFLDLSDNGKQPMCNEDGSIWLVFNGEIYNYPALREELKAKGHQFHSTSDSEVIIHGYEEWGAEVLQRLKGMFAFAIRDENKKQLFVARDRFGIKPLYYLFDAGKFIFASEIKGILAYPDINPEIRQESIAEFLTYRYIPPPHTIWKQISKLAPAHYITIKDNGDCKSEPYWTLESDSNKGNEQELISRVDEILLRSVEGHLLSDVPVGSFLSGGYDSSAMVYYASRLKYPLQTFAIGFDDWPESEHQYARIVADLFHTGHREVVLPDTSIYMAEKLAYSYDEPLADISIIPTYTVSQLASKHVKAVLSGEGADELFGGYWWQKKFFAENGNKRIRLQLYNLFHSNKPLQLDAYAEAMSMGYFGRAELKEILAPQLHPYIPDDPLWFYRQHLDTKLTPLKSIQKMDMNCFMSELVLQKVDRASMAHSLEVRVPFMDHELFELIFSQDERTYFKPNVTKYLLYENLKKALPDTILNRPKQGFVGPDKYFQNIGHYQSILDDGNLIRLNIITKQGLDKLIAAKDHWRLWKLLVLEYWMKEWM